MKKKPKPTNQRNEKENKQKEKVPLKKKIKYLQLHFLILVRKKYCLERKISILNVMLLLQM